MPACRFVDWYSANENRPKILSLVDALQSTRTSAWCARMVVQRLAHEVAGHTAHGPVRQRVERRIAKDRPRDRADAARGI